MTMRTSVPAVLRVALTLLLAGCLTVTACSSAPAQSQAVTSCGPAVGKFAPRCGALWGVYSLQGSNPATSVTDLEAQVGRRFDLTMRYHDFSDHVMQGHFPDAYEKQLGKSRTLVISWQARVAETSHDLSWKAIAEGHYDRFVRRAAENAKAWGRPMIIAFDAEFDNQHHKGTMADYVAAYRHIHQVFGSYHVTNVAWAWVSTGYLGAGNGRRIMAGYPGSSYVDWVGFDPYNFYHCNKSPWRSFLDKVQPTYRWLAEQGLGKKPVLLSEYGTQYDASNPARSRAWYTDMPAELRKMPNVKGLVRFDANGWFGPHRCNLYIRNGSGSLAAFAQAGRVVGSHTTR